ncbi:MAG: 4'-phosphopantetheinyl transferase superfamily protein [Clostridia bacterium]|nr:4'-phosphopantetheinyl transferase superfamily protein [Clostridia bacterium]
MPPYFFDITTVGEEEYKAWFSLMSEERKEKCRRIVSENGKKSCIAADHLARSILAKELDCSEEEIEIKITDSGKPYLEGNPLYFSVSHSDVIVACVCGDTPVGIDIELNRPVMAAAQERICTPEEWDYLSEPTSESERCLRFFELWTKKEAIFKMDGILPRKDREIPALHPETLGIKVTTEKMGKYTLSVAELICD